MYKALRCKTRCLENDGNILGQCIKRLNEPEHTLCHGKDQGYSEKTDHNSALKIQKAVSTYLKS